MHFEGRSTPTLDELRELAAERGIVDSLSRSHLHGILQEADLHPHRVAIWLHSPDPAFREKVNVICNLHRKAPVGSVVLSIDEKTGMQAISRKHLDRPPRPGALRRQEFEYVRHGTRALIAALDVHSGKTLAACGPTRTQADLLAFMEQVAKAYPHQQVHIVWDNLNTHRPGVWEGFNEKHGGRFQFHYTPIQKIACDFSWVNQRRHQEGKPMPQPLAAAADIQTKIATILGHEAVKVKSYGRHFLIQIDDNGELDTIARLTQINAKTYGVSFKSHTGRWDPLPEEGSCDEMITMLVEELGPYLDPVNY